MLSSFNRNALLLGTAALLAACAASQSPIGATSAIRIANTSHSVTIPGEKNYMLLHSFAGAPDGEYPEAGLVNVNGTLYGTTYRGGQNGLGTVFAITPSGTENVLYSFKGGAKDGALPEAGIINVSGTLYGTTSEGGSHATGTAYTISTSGNERVLYNFKGYSKDGSFPAAALTNVNGTLYGTTRHGGDAGCQVQGPTTGCGTVFSITTSGKESVLYKFAGGLNDGEYPDSSLVSVNGALYGTTPMGGQTICSVGCGTVFAITTSGKEVMLYRLGGSGNGANPRGGLLHVNGTLYGTTQNGGSSGWGTIFIITPSGSESVLYSFRGEQDGAQPTAGLMFDNGAFYGTTYSAGIRGKERNGHGTVFVLTPFGAETVLYRFKGHRRDGAGPQASLINVGDTLYGTTHFGGISGYGTVFSLQPLRVRWRRSE